MSMDSIIRADARLIVLRTLAEQLDGRLNSELLRAALESFGIQRTRAWVHDELFYLEQMGAVAVTEAGSVRVATLLNKGQQHLDRQLVIEGVKRPSRPGD
ncbi:MAG: hypothetical protein AB7U62_17710 [Pseudolabrys sp.]